MMTKTTQWAVTKYGELNYQSDIEGEELGVITTKIYNYRGKFYMELWDNGYCVHFSEVIN